MSRFVEMSKDRYLDVDTGNEFVLMKDANKRLTGDCSNYFIRFVKPNGNFKEFSFDSEKEARDKFDKIIHTNYFEFQTEMISIN